MSFVDMRQFSFMRVSYSRPNLSTGHIEFQDTSYNVDSDDDLFIYKQHNIVAYLSHGDWISIYAIDYYDSPILVINPREQ